MTDLDLPLRSPALYNPHLLSKEELVGLFSARQALLEELLQDLRSTPPGESAQHHLVVGQSGMGKTMLLRRLRFAVEDDPALRETWLPLSFPEEQYNVAALSDFWLNCVDALTDTLEGRGDEAAADDLDEAVEELRTVDDERERARRALDVLTGTADRLGKRLLLLVDNADLVLDRIGGEDEEWSLREVLSSQPAVTFVGASAAALESAYEYGRPFYDFFRAHELRSLDEDEIRTLLVRYSEGRDDKQVRELIIQDPARLRTLSILAGGNPRSILLLLNIFSQNPHGSIRGHLDRLLDHWTPAYKARLEAFPAQAQRVVHGLALRWHPVSAGELAQVVRLPVNNVSAQLNRLVREGIVEKVPYDPRTKTGFLISDRFFNIWYLMRASHRAHRKFIGLVEFLRMLYGRELRERVHHEAQLGEAEDWSRDAAELAEGGADASPSMASILVRGGKWDKAVALVQPLLRQSPIWSAERSFDDIMEFFRQAVIAGRVREAAELVDDVEISERWRPLREALEALARGNRKYLRRVAPEVRKPAEAILEELTAPREGVKDEAQGEAEVDSAGTPRPPKKPRKKPRAKA